MAKDILKSCNDKLSKVFGKAITAVAESRTTVTKDDKGKQSTKKHSLYALVTPDGNYITKGLMWNGLLNDQLIEKVVDTICKCDRWKAHDCSWLAKKGYVKRLIDSINAPKPGKATKAKEPTKKELVGKIFELDNQVSKNKLSKMTKDDLLLHFEDLNNTTED